MPLKKYTKLSNCNEVLVSGEIVSRIDFNNRWPHLYFSPALLAKIPA